MTVQNPPETKGTPPNWPRRLLYYAIAALLVTVTMKVGGPEQLCIIADGVTASVSKVDAFYVLKQTYDEYQRRTRLYTDYAAEHGGVAALAAHSSFPGRVLGSVWHGLWSTVASDWVTLLISLFALVLSLIILFRFMKVEPNPFSVLLAIPLSGLLAFVLKYLLLGVSYPFGCGGQFMVALLAIWPIIKTVRDVREMAQSVEGVEGVLKRWWGRGKR